MRQDTTRLHDDRLDYSHGMDGLYVGFNKGVHGGHCMFGGVFKIIFISVLLPPVIVVIVVIAFPKGGSRSSSSLRCYGHHWQFGHFESVTQRHSVLM